MANGECCDGRVCKEIKDSDFFPFFRGEEECRTSFGIADNKRMEFQLPCEEGK